jgi:phage baseplate assembly protein gpV
MYGEALINLIHREALRVLHRNTRRTPVVVDSYDPKTYAAKFKLMPDSVSQDVITGWIPLHTLQTGNNFGWHSPPNVGDHGWLDFHEDDREGGTFTAATFNDKFKPIAVDAGEVMYQHKTGSQIYFKKDGTVTVKDKGGNSIVMNGSDTITLTASKIVLAGTVYLGGADASKPVAMQGTVDSLGDTLVSNLATKALTK